MEGEGLMTLENEVVSGTWRNSQLNGIGTRKSTNGDTYKGRWVDGKLDGDGEYICEHGRYKGNFFKNVEHGFGIKIFADGNVYSGSW
jgi:hypothetical protein